MTRLIPGCQRLQSSTSTPNTTRPSYWAGIRLPGTSRRMESHTSHDKSRVWSVDEETTSSRSDARIPKPASSEPTTAQLRAHSSRSRHLASGYFLMQTIIPCQLTGLRIRDGAHRKPDNVRDRRVEQSYPSWESMSMSYRMLHESSSFAT